VSGLAYRALRALLFRLDPETAHQAALSALALASATAPGRAALRARHAVSDPSLAVEAFGLRFDNPLGLAAGYDKDARAVLGLAALGFGHVEVGTVTPRPQAGNPRPRIWRRPAERALNNRMGFPSAGAEVVARRLAALPAGRTVRVGVNLGKNRDTPLERAPDDYASAYRTVAPHADYAVVNVSSPNTPGLRELQGREHLEAILTQLAQARRDTRRIPLLVKVAPDGTDEALDELVDVLLDAGVDGVVATNTTVAGVAPDRGGLSGAPLRARATEVVARVHRRAGDRLPVVGVGGVFDAADVREKLAAGAVLVQLYTGLVYEGPGVVRRILTEDRTRGA